MKKILSIAFVVLLLNVSSSGAAEFTQTHDIDNPVRVKTTQLFEIIEDIQKYLLAEDGQQREISRGNIDFKSDKYDAKFDFPMTEGDIKKIPDDSLSFSLYIRPQNPNISSVWLVLSDNSKYIKVSGNNYDHVVGLLNIIKEKINPYLNGFGGSKHRMFLGAVFFLLTIGMYSYVMWKFGQPKVFVISTVLLILVQNAVLYAFRWETIFPGTLITHDNLSFLQKYSHIFTFLSFLIAIIPLGIFKRIAANKPLHRTPKSRRL